MFVLFFLMASLL